MIGGRKMLNPIPQNPNAIPFCCPPARKPVREIRPPTEVIPLGVDHQTNARGIGVKRKGMSRGRMMIGNADPSPNVAKLQNHSEAFVWKGLGFM
jgi:hypothetical protein